MRVLMERATAYLDKLEAERLTAIALSEEKAAEAKLIKAQQEGFQAAMEMFGTIIHLDNPNSINIGDPNSEPDKLSRRRLRRDIPQLILRELSFSGTAMTARQIAKAIDYFPDRTEAALERMKNSGKLIQNSDGRWAVVITTAAQPNGHDAAAIKKPQSPGARPAI